MRFCGRRTTILLSTIFAMFMSRAGCFFLPHALRINRRGQGVMTSSWLSTGNNYHDNEEMATTKEFLPPTMANLYREWSLEHDRMLWNNRQRSRAELAALLGRGIRGVEARLSKLQDVSSPAYERLFASSSSSPNSSDGENWEEKGKDKKLIPVGEVLRRIEWDDRLQPTDFSILHYDRLEDKTVESPMDAPNNSIMGKETMLAKALPEHRIVGVKYKERIVWDRNARIDLVFNEPGIYQVMAKYEEWKLERDRVQRWNRERQLAIADRIKTILGEETYGQLQQLSSDLLQAEQDPKKSIKTEIEKYVQQCLALFRTVRANPIQSLDPSLIPTGDYYALDELSELVAVLPNVELRGMLLAEISLAMKRVPMSSKGISSPIAGTNKPTTTSTILPIELREEELTETFVRGSGPGGQKINKTSNRVVLVHEPTQLRVECQETRSLQQNRKIARTRLKEKLDEYLNGSQSKLGVKQQKATMKKQKAKSKNRSRLKKKLMDKQLQQEDVVDDDSEYANDDDYYQ